MSPPPFACPFILVATILVETPFSHLIIIKTILLAFHSLPTDSKYMSMIFIYLRNLSINQQNKSSGADINDSP